MEIVIVDSSVIVKWLSKDREPNLDLADNLLRDAQIGKINLFAPELAKYEIGNVLLFSKKLPTKYGKIVLAQFFLLPITFISESQDISTQTYKLAVDLGITYYDASFLSLAKKYNAVLVTENIKHQGKTKDIKVKSLQDY